MSSDYYINLVRYRKKKKVNEFKKMYIENIKTEYDFELCLERNVLPSPISDDFTEELCFLSDVIYLPKEKKKFSHKCFEEEYFEKWLFSYLMVGHLMKQIRTWLDKLTINQSTTQIIEYSLLNVSKDIQRAKTQLLNSDNRLSVHGQVLNVLNGQASFNEVEHHYIDTLEVLCRYLLYNKSNDKRKKINPENWKNLFLSCQVWEGWQNIWSKIQLGEYQIQFDEEKDFFIGPKNKVDYLRFNSSKIRYENRLKEIHFLSRKVMGNIYEDYLLYIKKLVKKVSFKNKSLPFLLKNVDEKDLVHLITLRTNIKRVEQIVENVVFHGIDLNELVLRDNITCRGITEILSILKIYTDIYDALVADSEIEKIPFQKMCIKFNKREWKKVFKNVVNNPEEYLEFLTFKKERSQGVDIWCTPFINISHDSYMCLPHIISSVSTQYMLEQFLNVYNSDKNSEIIGKKFEETVCEELKKYSKYSVFNGKICGLEFDSLVYIEDLWLIVESKRTSTISSVFDSRRAKGRMREAVDQVKLRADFIMSKNGHKFIRKEFGENVILPSKKNTIKVVCMSITDLSGRIIDDSVITDLGLLKRYLANDKDTVEVLDKEKNQIQELVEIPTRVDAISKESLLSYLKDPHQITRIEDASSYKENNLPLDMYDDQECRILEYSYDSNKLSMRQKEILSEEFDIEIDDDVKLF